ncbi:PDDEXK-like family protein [Algoriphagus marinus]|uniref:hypothetical protein n=1 Tax=Algoriphagus marinus TaxID=1925762 RepID=UPI00094B9896|nr:hypothetical protein [Algoriphagus marinus]
MAEIHRNNTGLSGEYFVAAELYRRGWSVGMTLGNAKAVDLFAEKGNTRISVQVKSIYKAKNVGWPLMNTAVKQDCFYIFVNLNGDKINADLPDSPQYFVCTSVEALLKVKQYKTRGIVNLNSLNNQLFLERWDKLEI